MLKREAMLPVDKRMEFLCIVTPNHLHVPIAMTALEHGFHIMSDKPAGISLEEVEGLADKVTSTRLLYGLTHTYLGYPMVWQARHLVESGQIGELRRIYVDTRKAGWRKIWKQAVPSKLFGALILRGRGLLVVWAILVRMRTAWSSL